MQKRISTPPGTLRLIVAGGKLHLCDWEDHLEKRLDVRARIDRFLEEKGDLSLDMKIMAEAEEQLENYFSGKLKEFNLPLAIHGTDFQIKVWDELRKIPYGQTISYAALAARIGHPKAVRAVAGACRANALSLFIPCHRVISADGSLGGYAGGSSAKTHLLQLEKLP